MADIGDGDADDVAAGIARIAILFRMNRVVMIFRIRRVDGDEGNVAPVLAAGEIGRP